MQVVIDNIGFLLLGAFPNGPLGGLALTVVLGIFVAMTSLLFGIAVAAFGLSRLLVVRSIARGVVLFARGVPSLVFLFWMYFLIPRLLGLNVSGLVSAAVALTIYHGAYMAEDIRGGIRAVNEGQWDAARAIGLPPLAVLILVVFPQAIRAIIPALINRFVNLFMYTSVVSLVGIVDFLRAAKILSNRELSHPIEIFGFVGIVYFLFCYGLSRFGSYLESRWAWAPKVRMQQTAA
jgi:polar amino acid transport system permease protein